MPYRGALSLILFWRAISLFACVAFLGPAFAERYFDLQGHRGARGLAPENTLAGFHAGIAAGVSTLEMDVTLTKDGIVIVTHDRFLNPEIARDRGGKWVTNPSIRISSLTLLELQQYDVGRYRPDTPYYRRYPSYSPSDGQKIPTLDQVFESFSAKYPRIRFAIETKVLPEEKDTPVQLVDALLAVIDRHKVRSRVSIASFDWRSLTYLRKVAPDIQTSFVTSRLDGMNNLQEVDGAPSRWTGQKLADHEGSVPKMIRNLGGNIWSPFIGEIDRSLVAEAQALGLKVVPWTTNEPQQLRRLVQMGVDGIITDRPDVFSLILSTEMGFRLQLP